jgi:NAD(P)-dependent dehydrogenase (short-subunit alcohol dehydrogenase family)
MAAPGVGGGVVVVTGASAGVGRAVAMQLAGGGRKVALLARGESGLDAAAREVDERGGEAWAEVVDVASADAVGAAAARIEDEFGRIDGWINCAFAGVFAPTWEVRPEEFRRITDVAYLGYVHGTLAALNRMRPRDHGTIVQVGSALAYRGIPLQAPYCAAKHAIQGLTESLRCELLHEHSSVRVTMVQLPAVNTPQFDWVVSRLGRRPRPVAPIYEPEVAARGICHALDHPRRRERWVGASTALTIMANAVAPALLDRYLARTGFKAQLTDQADSGIAGNLWQPRDSGEDAGSHGSFDDSAWRHSAEQWCARHPAVAGGTTVGAAVLGWRALSRLREVSES